MFKESVNNKLALYTAIGGFALAVILLTVLYFIFSEGEKSLKDDNPADSAGTWIDENKGSKLVDNGKYLLTIVNPDTKKINEKGKAVLSTLTKEFMDEQRFTGWVGDDIVVSAIKQLKTQGDVAIISSAFSAVTKKNLMTWIRTGLFTEPYNEVVTHINKLPKYV